MTYSENEIAFRRALHLAVLNVIDARLAMPEDVRTHIDLQLETQLDFKDLSPAEKKELSDIVFQEITGKGAIDGLLANPDVSEIYAFGAHRIFKRVKGEFQLHSEVITSDTILHDILGKFARRAHARLDDQNPFFAELFNDIGDVTILLEPMVRAPYLHIKKSDSDTRVARNEFPPEGPITDPRAFLKSALEKNVGILITGNSRSGKTKFLNLLMNSIPPNLRVATIQDRSELTRTHELGMEFYTRLPNMEGEGEIPKSQLLDFAKRFDAEILVISDLYGDAQEKLVMDVPRLRDTICIATTQYKRQNFSRDFGKALKEDEKNKRWRELFPIVVELKHGMSEPTIHRIYFQVITETGPDLEEVYSTQ